MRIAVVGGSIGGLTSALLLLEKGHDVVIFERSAHLEDEAGGGIVMQAPIERMLRMLFKHTSNKAEQVLASIIEPVRGRQFLDQTGRFEKRMNQPQQMTSWSALWNALRGELANDRFRANEKVRRLERVRLSQAAPEWRVRVRCHEGEPSASSAQDDASFDFDLVIAADGQSSTVRTQLFEELGLGRSQPLLYAGYVAWRGVVLEEDLPQKMFQSFVDWFTFYHAEGTHLLLYVVPIHKNGRECRALNWVWYWNLDEKELTSMLNQVEPGTGEATDGGKTSADELSVSSQQSTRSSFSIPPGRLPDKAVTKLWVLAREELPRVLAELITAHTKQPFLQPIYDFASERAVFGFNSRDGQDIENELPVVLIGDAQCVLRPHTAYGTAKAVEDAIAVADAIGSAGETEFSRNDLRKKLAAWERVALSRNRRMSEYGQRLGESQKGTHARS